MRVGHSNDPPEPIGTIIALGFLAFLVGTPIWAAYVAITNWGEPFHQTKTVVTTKTVETGWAAHPAIGALPLWAMIILVGIVAAGYMRYW